MTKVRLFAVLREIAGDSATHATGATVRAVVHELSCRYGERFADVAARSTFAIDGKRASIDDEVPEGAELAILPPVSGGCQTLC